MVFVVCSRGIMETWILAPVALLFLYRQCKRSLLSFFVEETSESCCCALVLEIKIYIFQTMNSGWCVCHVVLLRRCVCAWWRGSWSKTDVCVRCCGCLVYLFSPFISILHFELFRSVFYGIINLVYSPCYVGRYKWQFNYMYHPSLSFSFCPRDPVYVFLPLHLAPPSVRPPENIESSSTFRVVEMVRKTSVEHKVKVSNSIQTLFEPWSLDTGPEV